LNSWTNLYETWYVYHGTWAHVNDVLHKSLPSVCVSVCVSLYRCLATACWTRRFQCSPCRMKGKSRGLSVYSPTFARQWLGKNIPGATNCWEHRFLCGSCRVWGKQRVRSSHNFLF
jgi:hypothetical protein